MKLQDSQSEIAKLVWSKLKYTQCHVDGLATSIIEIKEVWELISEIESIIKVKQDTIDLNVKTNMDLVKTIQKMINRDQQKWEGVLEWYANETNREVIEFDDYDLHVCKVAEQYANQRELTDDEIKEMANNEQWNYELTNKESCIIHGAKCYREHLKITKTPKDEQAIKDYQDGKNQFMD